jgi:hypothetical protein
MIPVALVLLPCIAAIGVAAAQYRAQCHGLAGRSDHAGWLRAAWRCRAGRVRWRNPARIAAVVRRCGFRFSHGRSCVGIRACDLRDRRTGRVVCALLPVGRGSSRAVLRIPARFREPCSASCWPTT